MTTNLRLGLTLSIVGPRAKLLETENWPMALRITVGTDSEPTTDTEKLAMVEKTLPWMIWGKLFDEAAKDGGKKVQVKVRILPVPAPPASESKFDPVETREVIKPLEDKKDFLYELKELVQATGECLANRDLLTFQFTPGDVVDKEEQTKPGDEQRKPEKRQAVPWPGLLATIQSMAAPTPSALQCIWYFTLPRTLLAEKTADGKWQAKKIYLSAAPAIVGTAQHDDENCLILPGGRYPVHKHKYKASAIEAHCEALELFSVLKHAGVDEMDNYWLAIHDSRDESLLDLGPRLDPACVPSAPLSVLSADELIQMRVIETEVHTENGTLLDKRTPTPPEAAAAIEGWKKSLVDSMKANDIRDRILRAATRARTDQVEAARTELRVVVGELLGRLAPHPLAATRAKVMFTDDKQVKEKIAALAESRLFPRKSLAPTAPSALDGIDLVVGDPSRRLRHIDETQFNAIDDVAQIQLFGRRSSDRSQLDKQALIGGAKWHPLSAAQYQLRNSTAKSTARLLGMTATYVDDVLTRELTYVGSNIACEQPLTDVHRDSLDDDPLNDQSFILAAPRNVPCTDNELRTLPLRYGDYYEFAAAVRDRAGGMAYELTGTYPWEADLSKIPLLDPPQRDPVQYLRRSAVGDCNITPGEGTSWPQTPADVALRCLEKFPTQRGMPAPSVIFLVPEDRIRFKPSQTGLPTHEYTFRVQAPQASEHVLLRWKMPATTLDQATRESAIKKLKEEMVAIFTERDQLIQAMDDEPLSNNRLAQKEVPEILPVDPAVAKVGMQWCFDSGGGDVDEFGTDVKEIKVSAGESSLRNPDGSFTVAKGDFLRLSFHALVANNDLDRFDPLTCNAHLDPEQDSAHPRWSRFRAFKGSDVYVETAASDLPVSVAEHLLLAEDSQGNIAVAYDFTSADEDKTFDYAEQVFIASERWVWRNLPIPPEEGHNGGSDRERRLASGPPLDLMDPRKRDSLSNALVWFDRISEIDDGFVGRKDQVVPYPRKAAGEVLLTVDARDEHAHADYLRYSVAFRSRYAPVLKEPMSPWTEKRRIATGFRGDTNHLKPPRVLAVLPLTQHMPAPGAESKIKECAPPFLVVLDEIWFREYGIGERLVARVARVKPEIPETPTNPPKEFRYGPLPDHYELSDVPDEDMLNDREQLEVFGPFGLSHERGGSQALANATAFVVYPPADTPPHFNLFVEFARVLDLPTSKNGKAPDSEYTEAVALYTLPNMADIALGDGKKPLKLKVTDAGFKCSGAGKLRPFPGANGEVMKGYCYVLVVGHHVRDGGRAVDVFLPADAMWLDPTDANDTLRTNWLDGSTRDVREIDYNAAVVLEILLNGRFPNNQPPNYQHPLKSATNLKGLFKLMLNDGKDGGEIGDAPGMIRRVSEWFEVKFGND